MTARLEKLTAKQLAQLYRREEEQIQRLQEYLEPIRKQQQKGVSA